MQMPLLFSLSTACMVGQSASMQVTLCMQIAKLISTKQKIVQ